jgi:hypothetical protein
MKTKYKCRGFFDKNTIVNIGDKHLTMANVEDISTLRIFIVDDVYELSLTENVYECTVFKINQKKLWKNNT